MTSSSASASSSTGGLNGLHEEACKHCGGLLYLEDDPDSGESDLKCVTCGRVAGRRRRSQAIAASDPVQQLRDLADYMQQRLREAQATIDRLSPVIKHLNRAIEASGSVPPAPTARPMLCTSCGHVWPYGGKLFPRKCPSCHVKGQVAAAA